MVLHRVAGSSAIVLYFSSLVTKSSPTIVTPKDHRLPSSSVHGIFQARILQWLAIPFSRRSSQPRDQIHISCIFCLGRWILYQCSTWEAPWQWEEMIENSGVVGKKQIKDLIFRFPSTHPNLKFHLCSGSHRPKTWYVSTNLHKIEWEHEGADLVA